jgi:hypothetical protein
MATTGINRPVLGILLTYESCLQQPRATPKGGVCVTDEAKAQNREMFGCSDSTGTGGITMGLGRTRATILPYQGAARGVHHPDVDYYR